MTNRRRVGAVVLLSAALGVGGCGGGDGGAPAGGERASDGASGEPVAGAAGEISGTVAYPAATPVEPGAVLSVRLVEVPGADTPGTPVGATLAATAAPVGERSAPFPFDLPYDTAAVAPGASHALTAAIRDLEGTVRWRSSEPTSWSPDSAGPVQLSMDSVPQAAGEGHGDPRMYRCAAADTFRFTVRSTGDEVAIHLPDTLDDRGLRVLGRAPRPDPAAAELAGTRYTDGHGLVLAVEDGGATLELGDRRFQRCEEVRWDAWAAARIRGAAFRALGQEPGWYLEVYRDGPIRLSYDYGQETAAARTWEREQRPDGRVYLADTDAGRLTATVSDEPCTDVMSGAEFEATVTVRLGEDRVLEGCGRVFRD